MRIKVFPSPLSGKIGAIASKSDAHRLFICAFLSNTKTKIKLSTSSVDIDTTLNCLSSLGAEITRENGVVEIVGSQIANDCTLDANESGSTLRFLIPVATALCDKVTFVGRGRLPERPIGELLDALKENGVSFSSDKLPFTTSGRLKSGIFKLPGNISSQYITGLLFALPLLEGDSEIRLTTNLESKGYIDITLSVLKKFGIEITKSENSYFIKGCQRYISPNLAFVDGDWSNSAFFLVSGAIKNSLAISGLDINSPQGDKAITDVLKRFGAKVTIGKEVTSHQSLIKGTTIDISEIPDMLPALAVLASFAEGRTEFTGGKRLRIKESDRLKSVADMINSLGGKAKELEEGLLVDGVGLKGGEVNSHNDHRIVMAAAIGGALGSGIVTINGAEAVNKSYPSFFEDFEKLGGKYCVI